MAAHGLSPSVFADKIGIQRSSVSHILSGRNKPGLDMIIKIIAAFPDVDAEWLLLGHKKPEKELSPSSTPPDEPKEEKTAENIPEEAEVPKPAKPHIEANTSKKIVKTILFYSDGTFESFFPGN
ncbi:MAG: XRE family transcriptional regulator [Chitinophagaceae bacterium]|nr:MAG: XRE family transcriptional regulator [Chitinophagaceae bacterium]